MVSSLVNRVCLVEIVVIGTVRSTLVMLLVVGRLCSTLIFNVFRLIVGSTMLKFRVNLGGCKFSWPRLVTVSIMVLSLLSAISVIWELMPLWTLIILRLGCVCSRQVI